MRIGLPVGLLVFQMCQTFSTCIGRMHSRRSASGLLLVIQIWAASQSLGTGVQAAREGPLPLGPALGLSAPCRKGRQRARRRSARSSR